MKKALPPKLRKFPAEKQRRLDRLLEKNSDGKISASEREALERLVADAEELMIVNAKRLAEFAEQDAEGPLAGAVPVTVWVQPHAQPTEP